MPARALARIVARSRALRRARRWRQRAGRSASSFRLARRCAWPPIRSRTPASSESRRAVPALRDAATQRSRRSEPGTYVLRSAAAAGATCSTRFAAARVSCTSITIPEGSSLDQIVPLLAHELGVPADSVQAAVRDTALLHALDMPTPTLEGYLFPDTYVFPDGTTARAAVRAMVRSLPAGLAAGVDGAARHAADVVGNDVMTLASIVEKEARLPEERPVIAAVYLNRLKAGMLLQADPTVQYALGKHVARVLYKDLEIESPYNTYKHQGLPPGPIASRARRASWRRCIRRTCRIGTSSRFPTGTTSFARLRRAQRARDAVTAQAWDSVWRRSVATRCARRPSAAPARPLQSPYPFASADRRLVAITDNLRDGIDGLALRARQRPPRRRDDAAAAADRRGRRDARRRDARVRSRPSTFRWS